MKTWKSLLCIVVTQALILTQTTALAQGAAQDAHNQGVAAGRAALNPLRGQITDARAGQVLPGYGTATSAPQRALYNAPNMPGQATAQHAACAGNTTDERCRAYNHANASANRPRDPAVTWDNANVAGARAIEQNPATSLTTLADYYSSCTLSSATTPGGVVTRACTRNVGVGSIACRNQLMVDVERTPNCEVGSYVAHAQSGSVGVDVQCLMNRTESNQRFRVTENGEPIAHFDVDMTQASPYPRAVATLATVGYDVAGNAISTTVYASSQQCSGTSCSLTVLIATPRSDCTYHGEGQYTCVIVEPFIPTYAACPSGTQSGDNLAWSACGAGDSGCSSGTLTAASCYTPAGAGTAATDITGTFAAAFWVESSQRAVVGYLPNPAFGPIPTLTLSYTRPDHTDTVVESWTTNCPAATAGSRCSVTTPPRCIDGPSTRIYEGVELTRDCWESESTMSCQGSVTESDTCSSYAAPGSGCVLQSSTCSRVNPGDPAVCDQFRDEYQCPEGPQTQTRVSNCPTDVYCVGTTCHDTRNQPDADFARSMAMIEAAREAGIYVDVDRMKVFNGENNRCRDRLLVDCCEPDSAGRGMSNQSVLGSGSTLVFDLLMQSGVFLTQAVASLLASSAFTGSISAYGFSVYVVTGDAAVPVVSNIVYAGTAAEGSVGVIVGFDIWTLIIAIVIHILISSSTCNENEARTAMSEGAHLCHSVHRWCSHRNPDPFPPPGAPRCLTYTTSKCCFNSVIARIINQQGRAQLGRDWGPDPENPECRGFTIAELQALDFAAMDLSEFYASLIPPGSVGETAAQGANATRLVSCYYGQGRCSP